LLDRTILALSGHPAGGRARPGGGHGLPGRATLAGGARRRDRKARTCKQSLEVMEACAYGASGDVALGEAVTEKCEGEFVPKLNKAQRSAYEREQKLCDQKYRRESGTMYRSFEAFCRAQNATRTAEKFGKRPGRK
jgi:hypothetical protein